MIRQFCRNIARVFGGQGGVRNLAVIFILIAGLLLSCCFLLVAVAGGTPGKGITSVTSTPLVNVPTPTPTSVGPTPTSAAPTPTPTSAAPTPTQSTQPTPTPTSTTPPVAPSPTQSANGKTPAPTVCAGTPTGSVPCNAPGTGGGPGSGPQSGVENGGMVALALVVLFSLVLVAGGVVGTLRIRRARGR